MYRDLPRLKPARLANGADWGIWGKLMLWFSESCKTPMGCYKARSGRLGETPGLPRILRTGYYPRSAAIMPVRLLEKTGNSQSFEKLELNSFNIDPQNGVLFSAS
jgi:hypothetical protein